MRRYTAGVGLVMLAASLVACSDDKSSTTTPGQMAIAPDSATVFVGDSLQLAATNAPGFITWSSSDSTIASVLHGVVHAFAHGQVTISANAGNVNAAATITVTSPPTIALATTGVTFEVNAGGAAPVAQTVGVANGGDGPLDSLGLALVTYSTGASGWLTATLPANANAPTQVTIQPNTTTLAAGTYSATVPVTAKSATNSPRSFTVTYIVDPPSIIVLSRSSVPISAQANGTLPSTQTVGITNTGGGSVTGLGTGTITYSAGASGWLTGTLTSTTAPSTLTLTVTSTALPVGTYTASVPVTSSVTGVPSLPVTVTYSVTTAPPPVAINLSGNTASFSALTGGALPASQPIVITNGGAGTLNGLTAPVTYGSGASGWLSAGLSSTTAPATLNLQPSTVLAAGTYTANVAVTSGVANNSPQNVSVTYTVMTAPSISLASNSASFLSTQANVDPANQMIGVSNSGGSTLSGLSTGISYTGPTTGWLTATIAGTAPLSPSTTPLTLQVTTGSITPGTYTATVTVSSSIAGVTPRTVIVSFERQATLTNDIEGQVFATFGCTGCHASSPGPDNVDLSDAITAYNSLVNQPGTEGGTLVIPGDSTNSYLYHQITAQTAHDNMPFSCAVAYDTTHGCLSAVFVHLVATWIQQGAAQ